MRCHMKKKQNLPCVLVEMLRFLRQIRKVPHSKRSSEGKFTAFMYVSAGMAGIYLFA